MLNGSNKGKETTASISYSKYLAHTPGLKVNHNKTEILVLGNMEINSSELLGVNGISKVMKILGVNFTSNHSLFYKLNF